MCNRIINRSLVISETNVAVHLNLFQITDCDIIVQGLLSVSKMTEFRRFYVTLQYILTTEIIDPLHLVIVHSTKNHLIILVIIAENYNATFTKLKKHT